MKFLVILGAISLSVSAFATTLGCKVDILKANTKIETLEMKQNVTNVGGNGDTLRSADNKFLFEIGAINIDTSNAPGFKSNRLVIHVYDNIKQTSNSLTAWFNDTENLFRFEGGDTTTEGSTYVGRCSIKYL